MIKVQWLEKSGQVLDLPGINGVSFDENGETELPEVIAMQLEQVFGGNGFLVINLFDEKETTPEQEVEEIEPVLPEEEKEIQEKVEEIVEAVKEQEQDDLKTIIEDKSTTVAKLQELAETHNLPKEDWELMKKAELRNYLIKSFNLED